MTDIITAIGWFGFLVAIVYFVVYDRMGGTAGVDYVRGSRDILLVSAALVVGGYVLKFAGSAAGVGRGRCKKCGKRIEKQEMFCFDHRLEAIRQAQERTRSVNQRK
jgi:hypothetical protein